jgi:hypothetical protein
MCKKASKTFFFFLAGTLCTPITGDIFVLSGKRAVRSEPLLFKKLQTFTIFYASITPYLVLFISVPLNCLKLTSPEWMFFPRVHEKKIGRHIIRICCSFFFFFFLLKKKFDQKRYQCQLNFNIDLLLFVDD